MSLRFDAATDALNHSTGFGGTPASASVWAKIVTDQNAYSAVLDLGGGASGYQIVTDSDGTTFIVYGDGANKFTGFSASVGTWYFIAVTIDPSGTSYFYYAAEGASSVTQQSQLSSFTGTATTTLEIGDDGFGGPFDGDICALKVWGAALSQAEIEKEWRYVLPVRMTNLEVCYPLIINNGDTHLQDIGANGRNLTAGATTPANSDHPRDLIWAPQSSIVFVGAAGTTHDGVATKESISQISATPGLNLATATTTAESVSAISASGDLAVATLEQEGYRFRNDDGSEALATWRQAQDTNDTIAANTNIRLRVLIDSSGNPASQQYQLEYRKKGPPAGPWKKITTQ